MGMAPGGFGGEGVCPVSSPSLTKNPSSSLVQATATTTATAHQFCRARLGMRWSPPSPRHVSLGGQLASLLWPLAVTSFLLWNCGQGQQRDECQGLPRGLLYVSSSRILETAKYACSYDTGDVGLDAEGIVCTSGPGP